MIMMIIPNYKLQIIKPVSAEPAALGMLITWQLTNAETRKIFVAYNLIKGCSMSFQAHVPPAWPFKRESFLKDDTRRDHDNLKDARVHSRLIPPSLASQTLLFWSLHVAPTSCKTSQFFTTTGFRRIVTVCDPAQGTSTSRACRPQSLQRAAGQRCSGFNGFWQWCWILNIERGVLLNV